MSNPTNKTTAKKINSTVSPIIVSHTKYGNLVHNCTGCPRKFTTVAAVRRHGHFCTGFPASQTSETSSSNSSAPKTSHRYTLKFPQCLYLASEQWNLNRHSIMHTDEWPFACALCPYTGRYSWRLREHHQGHHPAENFPFHPRFLGTDHAQRKLQPIMITHILKLQRRFGGIKLSHSVTKIPPVVHALSVHIFPVRPSI